MHQVSKVLLAQEESKFACLIEKKRIFEVPNPFILQAGQ